MSTFGGTSNGSVNLGDTKNIHYLGNSVYEVKLDGNTIWTYKEANQPSNLSSPISCGGWRGGVYIYNTGAKFPTSQWVLHHLPKKLYITNHNGQWGQGAGGDYYMPNWSSCTLNSDGGITSLCANGHGCVYYSTGYQSCTEDEDDCDDYGIDMYFWFGTDTTVHASMPTSNNGVMYALIRFIGSVGCQGD